MFCFKSILQIWIISIAFRDTNNLVNLGICKREFLIRQPRLLQIYLNDKSDTEASYWTGDGKSC